MILFIRIRNVGTPELHRPAPGPKAFQPVPTILILTNKIILKCEGDLRYMIISINVMHPRYISHLMIIHNLSIYQR